jgi:tetratricopeptide (TPR) repeat protein
MHFLQIMVSCAQETQVMRPRPEAGRRRLRRLVALFGVGLVTVSGLSTALAFWIGGRPRVSLPTHAAASGLSAADLHDIADEVETLITSDMSAVDLAPQGEDFTSEPPDSLARGRFWIREGERLERGGRSDDALAAFDRAQVLLPHTPVPCLKAARVLLTLNKPTELRRFAICARERDPHLAAAYLYEGVALQLLGDKTAAAECYAAFARLAPRSARAREAEFVSRQLSEIGRFEQVRQLSQPIPD